MLTWISAVLLHCCCTFILIAFFWLDNYLRWPFEARSSFLIFSSGNDAPCTSLMPMEYIDQIMLKFKRLLVRISFFYLHLCLWQT